MVALPMVGPYGHTCNRTIARQEATTDGRERVARTVTLPSPAARVWQALVEPARLARWLGAEVTLEPRVGGRVGLVDDEGERRGTVEALEAGRRLVLRVWAPPTAGGSLAGSRIEFLLDDLGQSTRLTVTEHRLGSRPFSEMGTVVPPLTGGSVPDSPRIWSRV